ncbi:MAG TPA: hypothetical protein VE908_14505 [Mycobacterium sp.]|jgi:hypothetical protein|nr:hypothetical protein [Mycobacterium sp.]
MTWRNRSAAVALAAVLVTGCSISTHRGAALPWAGLADTTATTL